MTLLIFDCDGTLVETEMLHAKAELSYLRQRFGYDSTPEEHNRRYAGVGMNVIYDEIARQTGLPVPPEINDEITALKQKTFAGHVVPVAHVMDAIDSLAAYPRCVASNAETDLLRSTLQEAGLLEKFEPHVFSSSMVARPKPAPDLFLYAAEQMNRPVSDCIVIEDSIPGVTAAKAAGMRVLGFAGASHCQPGYAERLKDADVVFTDMRELPRLISSLVQTMQPKAASHGL